MMTIMNSVAALLLSACLGTSLTGCSLPSGNAPSNGKVLTKKYSVSGFKHLENLATADIVFTQGPVTRVEAKGDADYLSCIEVVVQDSTLILRLPKKEAKRFKDVNVVFTISCPELCSVYQRGVGDISLTGTVKADDLSLNVNGVGSLKAEALDTRHLTVRQRGVGSMVLQGKSQRAELEQKGVGSLKAKDLEAEEVVARQAGVGSLSCRASRTIAIYSSGIGSVDYYGDAQVVEMKKSGIGSVEKHD